MNLSKRALFSLTRTASICLFQLLGETLQKNTGKFMPSINRSRSRMQANPPAVNLPLNIMSVGLAVSARNRWIYRRLLTAPAMSSSRVFLASLIVCQNHGKFSVSNFVDRSIGKPNIGRVGQGHMSICAAVPSE